MRNSHLLGKMHKTLDFEHRLMQGCQLLRFERSLLRFSSLTTPENTPSKNYAEQKFRSEIPIP